MPARSLWRRNGGGRRSALGERNHIKTRPCVVAAMEEGAEAPSEVNKASGMGTHLESQWRRAQKRPRSRPDLE